MKFIVSSYVPVFFAVFATALTSGCGITHEPFDPVQDNPATALPEKIVIFGGGSKSDESEPATAPTDFKTSTQYQQWLQEKQSNSDDYQEFLEYQQWLEFKELKKSQ